MSRRTVSPASFAASTSDETRYSVMVSLRCETLPVGSTQHGKRPARSLSCQQLPPDAVWIATDPIELAARADATHAGIGIESARRSRATLPGKPFESLTVHFERFRERRG